jgi:hypothetical protein
MKPYVALPLAGILALGEIAHAYQAPSTPSSPEVPSTLTVTPGQHTIAVKKKGYADWTRTMNVSGTSVHLSADLASN